MSVWLIIGGQWGDEGKAKIVDYLAEDTDYVVRYQGGANAGHTVVTDGQRYAFHLLPSGVLYPKVTCLLGGGMVIDPFALVREIENVERGGIEITNRLLVSEQAHVVLPHHIALDGALEDKLGSSSIGTTRKGITPAYADKIGRKGLRMGELRRSRSDLEARLIKHLREKNRVLKEAGVPAVPVKKTVEQLLSVRRRLGSLIVDTRVVLWSAIEKRRKILLEGAQGTLLDIDHGTYPFVTSSHPSIGGALTGTGLPASAVDKVLGIFKAYCTRVGNGPFPTEARRRKGERLRERGQEYGTTTGRPRRCGWFDAVAARTAVKLNGITEIALTKLDVLDDFDEIKVCTSYRLGRNRVEYFPTDTSVLTRCKPHYEVLEGWRQQTGGGRRTDLPRSAAAYVSYLEELVGCRIELVSCGPDRDAMIRRA